MVGPGESVVSGVKKLLVGILIGRAGPNLKFCPIDILAVNDVQALASKDLDGSSIKSPFLGIGTSASL